VAWRGKPRSRVQALAARAPRAAGRAGRPTCSCTQRSGSISCCSSGSPTPYSFLVAPLLRPVAPLRSYSTTWVGRYRGDCTWSCGPAEPCHRHSLPGIPRRCGRGRHVAAHGSSTRSWALEKGAIAAPHLLLHAVVDPAEPVAAADGPCDGEALQPKLLLQLLYDLKGVERRAVHLVDEREDGQRAHPGHLRGGPGSQSAAALRRRGARLQRSSVRAAEGVGAGRGPGAPRTACASAAPPPWRRPPA
jgi:hypothetical protein